MEFVFIMCVLCDQMRVFRGGDSNSKKLNINTGGGYTVSRSSILSLTCKFKVILT